MSHEIMGNFESFLTEKDIPESKAGQYLAIAEKFDDFLKQIEHKPSADLSMHEQVNRFSEMLIDQGLNTRDSYRALMAYGQYLKNNDIYIVALELIDGAEALDNLYARIGKKLGQQKQDEIFDSAKPPPLGTPTCQMPGITRIVMERLETAADATTIAGMLSGSLRDLKDEWFEGVREKFLQCRDIDEFIERKGEDFISSLERLRDQSELFFTQEIDDNVIEFVRTNPEIRQGVRKGDVLYETKIPYMTREWLAEADESLQRYYYCHCPWVRESLKEGQIPVSPTFCICSAGFHKRYWEVAVDQPLQAEVVETVLKGDHRCRFAIHLPETCLPSNK
ncbi:MAG: hypothetical protein JSU65_13430 [Candidatus Zixiibacteriota bacterium]|nr:MAG: hypothetical protein JSU65_13430 [candidate division Zixibacteria bacterium]